ncbi:uncharacterized protein LOC105686689 isoform X1 [Athalia rosae]|uniref:uncharacterized protein LOC105686689 isoform X1 n=2 Tax=Athalia rosae TaxID=37344 RepID=UPI00203369D5|nr:uncharacterized protein LOC105686689 isoform X1 [Athalia rosae]XP_048508043.1 uncharacterized protein LOC105686689 isoform X1 [Athalia rosae]
MHFWINKPAGRYYGFGGRRYPATPLPKIRSGHHRRGSEVIRPMVTPVHRFQSLNGVNHAPGPSSTCNYGPRHLRPPMRTHDVGSNNNTENISLQHVQSAGNGPNNTSCHGIGEHVGNSELRPAGPSGTAGDIPHGRGLLDFSDFTDAELAGHRLRCGVWITIVLAGGFIVAAKFYFDHQGTGLEVLTYCGLLVTLLLSGCFYSILCRRTEDSTVRDNVLAVVQDDPIAALTAANTIANENIGLPPSVPPVGQNPPPPPYHIAILIPPSHSADEIPPPSYDKIAVR